MAKPDEDFPRGSMELQDTTIGWRFTNKKLEEMYGADSMPETAENVAERYSISREDQDQFAFQSQLRAKKAMERKSLCGRNCTSCFHDRKGNEVVVDQDEHPRPDTTIEKLS